MISVGRTSGKASKIPCGNGTLPAFAYAEHGGYGRGLNGTVGGVDISDFELPEPVFLKASGDYVIHAISRKEPIRILYEENVRQGHGRRGRKQRKGCTSQERRRGIQNKRESGSLYFNEMVRQFCFETLWWVS